MAWVRPTVPAGSTHEPSVVTGNIMARCWPAYAISEARWTYLGTFVTGISRIGDGVSALILSPRPTDITPV